MKKLRGEACRADDLRGQATKGEHRVGNPGRHDAAAHMNAVLFILLMMAFVLLCAGLAIWLDQDTPDVKSPRPKG